MPGRRFSELEKLTFDCPHAGHEAVEFTQEMLFILASLLDKIGARAVADPLKRICEPRVEEPHMPLQIDELPMQLTLLEHNPISSGAAV